MRHKKRKYPTNLEYQTMCVWGGEGTRSEARACTNTVVVFPLAG